MKPQKIATLTLLNFALASGLVSNIFGSSSPSHDEDPAGFFGFKWDPEPNKINKKKQEPAPHSKKTPDAMDPKEIPVGSTNLRPPPYEQQEPTQTD